MSNFSREGLAVGQPFLLFIRQISYVRGKQNRGNTMKQNKAYRAAGPEDLAILSAGEIGAMVLSAGLMLVLVWFITGPI
jgi:hypothetical protein